MDLDQRLYDENFESFNFDRTEQTLPPNPDLTRRLKSLEPQKVKKPIQILRQERYYKSNEWKTSFSCCGCLTITGLTGLAGLTALAIYSIYQLYN